MDLFESVKEFYFSIEDKWYALMDSLEKKGIPVYKVLDPIDKVVPSFALFLGLNALFLLLLFVLIFLFLFGSGTTTVSFMFVNELRDPLSGVNVSILQEANEELNFEEIYFEDFSDEKGLIKTELNPLFPVKVNASLTGFTSFEKEFDLIDEDGKQLNLITINLTEESFGPRQRTIIIYDLSTSIKINKHASFQFSCTQGNAPGTKMSSNGETTVTVSNDCTSLFVSVTVEGYQPKTESANIATNRIYLNPIETDSVPPSSGTGTVFVSVEDEEGNPVSGVRTRILNTFSKEEVDSKTTGSAGTSIFILDAFKQYTLEVRKGTFFREKDFYLNEDEDKDFEFVLEEDEEFESDSKIFIKFIEETNSNPIPAVRAFLIRGNMLRIPSFSDEDGLVLFDWSLDETIVLAVKSNYVTKLFEPELKELDDFNPQIEELSRADETNSGEIIVEVYYPEEYGGGLVEGAYVLLKDENDVFWGNGMTSSEGIVLFKNMPPGTYYAGAGLSSEDIFGESIEKELEAGESITLQIVLDSDSTGFLQVKVFDLISEELIEDAKVQVLEKGTNKLIDSFYTDEEGLTELIKLSSSNEYNLIVSKEGFEEINSTTQIIPFNQTILEEVFLIPEDFCFQAPRNEFIRLKSNAGTVVPIESNVFQIAPEINYTAEFLFCFPEKNYDLAGLIAHFQADESNKPLNESQLVFTEAGEIANYKPFNEIPENKYSVTHSMDNPPFKVINYLHSNAPFTGKGTLLLKTKFNLTGKPNENRKLFYGGKYITNTEENELDLQFIEVFHESVNPHPDYKLNFLWNGIPLISGSNFNNSIEMEENDEGELEFSFTNNSFELIKKGKIIISSIGNALNLYPTEFEFENLNHEETFPINSMELIEIIAENQGNQKLDFKVLSYIDSEEEETIELYSVPINFTVNFRPETLKTMNVSVSNETLFEGNTKYGIDLTVKDSETDEPITGANIKVKQGPHEIGTVHELDSGNYKWVYNSLDPLKAENGNIKFKLNASRYIEKEIEIELISFDSEPTEFQSIECIQFLKNNDPLPETGIELKTNNLSAFTIKNNCDSPASFTASTAKTTSDLLIGLSNNPLDNQLSFNLPSNQFQDFFVKSQAFAGIHPVYFNFTVDEIHGKKEVLVKVHPPIDVFPFYLIEKDSLWDCLENKICIPKYEFDISNSSDSAYVVYFDGLDLWGSTGGVPNQGNPWALVFDSEGDGPYFLEWVISDFVYSNVENVHQEGNRFMFETIFNKNPVEFDSDNPVKYQLIGLADFKEGYFGSNIHELLGDYKNLSFGVFHARFIGHSEDCINAYTGVEGKTGEIGLNYFDETNNSYSWPNIESGTNKLNGFNEMLSRCEEKYCDGVQTMQLVSYWLNALQEGFNGEIPLTDLGEYDGRMFNSNSKRVLLKKEGYVKPLITDFINGSGNLFLEVPGPFTLQPFKDLLNKSQFAVQIQPNPIEPGTYEIKLVLVWDELADRNDLSKVTSIGIVLKKLQPTDSQNPLIYLPFDADLMDSTNKRDRYGVVLNNAVSFSSLREFDSLPVKNENNGLGAVTLHLGTDLTSNSKETFIQLNSGNKKGNLLKITNNPNNPNEFIALINLAYPSLVKMKLNYSGSTPAHNLGTGFYSIKMRGESDPLNSIDKWSALQGIRNSCNEFSGKTLPKNYLASKGSTWNQWGFIAPDSGNLRGISFIQKNNENSNFSHGEIELGTIYYIDKKLNNIPIEFTPASGAQGFFEVINASGANPFNLKALSSNTILAYSDESVTGNNTSLTGLIKTGNACIYSGNNELSIWWNEEQLFDEHAGRIDSCKTNANENTPFPPDWGQGFN